MYLRSTCCWSAEMSANLLLLLESQIFFSTTSHPFPISPSSLCSSNSNDGGSDVYWTAVPWQQRHNTAFSVATWPLLLCHWVIQLPLAAVSCCKKMSLPQFRVIVCVKIAHWRNAGMFQEGLRPCFPPLNNVEMLNLAENVWVLIVKYVITLWLTLMLENECLN